ncbi:HU family DNA-binding protein [bacterium]|nr:HU family DNA-binding protein [bacterium]
MGKQEIIKVIAKKANLTNVESEAVIKAFFQAVKESLKKGEKVLLVGFGSFATVKRAARTGVNPQNKKKIQIPAKKVVKFVVGKELKELVNKGK